MGFYHLLDLWVLAILKKHLAAFIALKGHETPPFHLYNSLDANLLNREKHELWLKEIRKVVSERILNEEERVPSITLLLSTIFLMYTTSMCV